MVKTHFEYITSTSAPSIRRRPRPCACFLRALARALAALQRRCFLRARPVPLPPLLPLVRRCFLRARPVPLPPLLPLLRRFFLRTAGSAASVLPAVPVLLLPALGCTGLCSACVAWRSFVAAGALWLPRTLGFSAFGIRH